MIHNPKTGALHHPVFWGILMFFGAPNVQTKPWIHGPCAAIEKPHTLPVSRLLSLWSVTCVLCSLSRLKKQDDIHIAESKQSGIHFSKHVQL